MNVNVNDRRGPSSTSKQLQNETVLRSEAKDSLHSREAMTDVFRRRLSGIFPKGSILQKCRPHILRSRQASRQVVAYQLVFSDKLGQKRKPMTLVVKRFADQAKGKREYAAMKILWENGFSRDSRFRIPEPFCYWEDLGLLVQEKAHGISLRKYLGQSRSSALEHMKGAARWLEKLHHLRTDDPGIPIHPSDEGPMVKFVRQVADREPRVMERMEKLASRILTKLSFYKDPCFTPVHGDFQCDNIFVSEEGVTVIDFGRLSKSDRARDLGYMMAQVHVMSLLDGAPRVSPGLRAFWEEYRSTLSGDEGAFFSARTCLFAAMKCLENLGYILSFSSPGEGREIVDFLLVDAARFCDANGVEEVLERPGSS